MITTNLDRGPFSFTAFVRNVIPITALFVVASPSLAQEPVAESEPAVSEESAEENSKDGSGVADPIAIWKDAEQLHKVGKYAEAAKRYGEVIQIQPNYAPAILGKAKCMQAIGELRIANQLASDAASLASTRAPELYGQAQAIRAQMLIDIGLYSEAVGAIQSSIAQDPADANFILLRAIATRNLAEQVPNDQTKLLKQALKSLKRASKIVESSKDKSSKSESLHREILFEKGLVNVALGRPDEAYQDITKSFENSDIEKRFAQKIARIVTRDRIRAADRTPVAKTGR